MSGLALVLIALAVPPAESGANSSVPAAAASTSAADRPLREWRTLVSEACRRTIQVQGTDLEAATRSLVALYEELVTESRLPPQDREPLRQQMRSRLLAIQEKLPQKIGAPNPVLAQQLPPGVAVQPAAGLPAAGIPQQRADYGPELVSLIQQVISPPSWDVNGGPGTIIYYRPLNALIIRQTGAAHEQMGDLLQQLRRN